MRSSQPNTIPPKMSWKCKDLYIAFGTIRFCFYHKNDRIFSSEANAFKLGTVFLLIIIIPCWMNGIANFFHRNKECHSIEWESIKNI